MSPKIAKGTLQMWLRLQTFRWGDYFVLFNVIKRVLESRRRRQKRRLERWQCKKDLTCCWLWRWKKGPHSMQCMKPSWRFEKPSIYNQQENRDHRTTTKYWIPLPTQMERKQSLERNAALVLAQWDLYWTSGLQNCNLLNVCCFKPLTMEFVRAAIGDYCTLLHDHS